MMTRKTMEVWVGVFVAAGLFALGVLAFRVGNLTAADITNGYQVEARFENIGGLKVKSPVTLAGVRVGRVTAIAFDNATYEAIVKINLDGRYNTIPVDSNAAILTSGLLGEQYIGIEPGVDETYLKEGGRIKRTQPALVLEKLVGQFLYNAAKTPETGKK